MIYLIVAGVLFVCLTLPMCLAAGYYDKDLDELIPVLLAVLLLCLFWPVALFTVVPYWAVKYYKEEVRQR